jgi:hypothetical protein
MRKILFYFLSVKGIPPKESREALPLVCKGVYLFITLSIEKAGTAEVGIDTDKSVECTTQI